MNHTCSDPRPPPAGMLVHLVRSIRPDRAHRMAPDGRIDTAVIGLGAQGTRHARLMRKYGTSVTAAVALEQAGRSRGRSSAPGRRGPAPRRALAAAPAPRDGLSVLARTPRLMVDLEDPDPVVEVGAFRPGGRDGSRCSTNRSGGDASPLATLHRPPTPSGSRLPARTFRIPRVSREPPGTRATMIRPVLASSVPD